MSDNDVPWQDAALGSCSCHPYQKLLLSDRKSHKSCDFRVSKCGQQRKSNSRNLWSTNIHQTFWCAMTVVCLLYFPLRFHHLLSDWIHITQCCGLSSGDTRLAKSMNIALYLFVKFAFCTCVLPSESVWLMPSSHTKILKSLDDVWNLREVTHHDQKNHALL